MQRKRIVPPVKRTLVCLGLFWWGLTQVGNAQPLIHITSPDSTYTLLPYCHYATDSTALMLPTSSSDLAFSWDSLTGNTRDHWLKFRLYSAVPNLPTLYTSSVYVDRVKVYQQGATGGWLAQDLSGFSVPLAERSFPYARIPQVRLHLPSQDTTTYLLHLVNTTRGGQNTLRSSLTSGFHLDPEPVFHRWDRRLTRVHQAMLGMVGLSMVYALCLFLLLRDPAYGYLLLYNFGFFAWIFINGGFMAEWGLISSPKLERILRHFVPYVGVTAGYSFFVLHFYQLHTWNRWLAHAIRVLTWIYILAAIPYVFQVFEWPLTIHTRVSPIIMLLIWIGALSAVIRKQPFSVLFFVGATLVTGAHLYFIYAYLTPNVHYVQGHLVLHSAYSIELFLFALMVGWVIVQERRRSQLFQTMIARLQGQLEAMNRKLASQALIEAKQKEALQELARKVRHSDQDLHRRVRSLESKTQDWDQFKVHFEAVHPDFFTELQSRFPNLTAKEARHCAFIRMGLQNKEIATLNGVSVRAVEKARERLRDKLKLTSARDIQGVVCTI